MSALLRNTSDAVVAAMKSVSVSISESSDVIEIESKEQGP
jgi:hypothetical protein